jgi:hypothetical protein
MKSERHAWGLPYISDPDFLVVVPRSAQIDASEVSKPDTGLANLVRGEEALDLQLRDRRSQKRGP